MRKAGPGARARNPACVRSPVAAQPWGPRPGIEGARGEASGAPPPALSLARPRGCTGKPAAWPWPPLSPAVPGLVGASAACGAGRASAPAGVSAGVVRGRGARGCAAVCTVRPPPWSTDARSPAQPVALGRSGRGGRPREAARPAGWGRRALGAPARPPASPARCRQMLFSPSSWKAEFLCEFSCFLKFVN